MESWRILFFAVLGILRVLITAHPTLSRTWKVIYGSFLSMVFEFLWHLIELLVEKS